MNRSIRTRPFLLTLLLAILAALNLSAAKAASPEIDPATVDITGTYRSIVTTRRGKRRSVVKLVQSGKEIIGTWDDKPDDRLVGTRDGDTILFEWYLERAGYDLVGRWQIKANGIDIEGRWERPDGASGGKWKLSKIE